MHVHGYMADLVQGTALGHMGIEAGDFIVSCHGDPSFFVIIKIGG
jgi:hypothetical protein